MLNQVKQKIVEYFFVKFVELAIFSQRFGDVPRAFNLTQLHMLGLPFFTQPFEEAEAKVDSGPARAFSGTLPRSAQPCERLLPSLASSLALRLKSYFIG